MATVKVTGLEELIGLTDKLADRKQLLEVCKPALKETGAEMTAELQGSAPVSKSLPKGRTSHGRDLLKLQRIVSKNEYIAQPAGLKKVIQGGSSWNDARGKHHCPFKIALIHGKSKFMVAI